MNRKEILANMPVLQAFADGKTIQYRARCVGATWYDIKEDAIFDFARFEYQIKPEPKRFWILRRGDGSAVGDLRMSAEDADTAFKKYTENFGRIWGPYSVEEYVQVIK